MSLVVNSYFLPSYQVSCSEFATPAVFVGCVGLPWANLHWQLANTVDRTVNMDVSRSKVQSWIKYYGFRTDHCSREMNITTSGVWQQEIDALPYGVYFVRMHKPTDNHKLEARGHSMIYVHEEGDIGFFYDNNWALEKISAINNSTNGTLLYERLLNVHRQWDIPSTRFYRLQPDT